MSEIVPIASHPRFDGGNSGGNGPEDPMLEKRVEVLEQKVDRILGAIERLEPAIRDIAAEQKEFRKSLTDLQVRMTPRDESNETRKMLSDVAVRIASIDGQLKNIPSTWQMITYIMGSQVVLAGLLFTALKFGLK